MYIVIAGGSTTAEQLISTLKGHGHRFAIIEEDLETFEHLAEVMPSSVTLVEGDSCDPDTQRDAGVDYADLFVALMGHDETNYVACELAMQDCGVPRCISSINSPRNIGIFKHAGIEPISSAELISHMVEQEAFMGSVRQVLTLRTGDIIIAEIKLPVRMKHKNGIRVDEVPVHRDAQLIAVVRDDDLVMVNDDIVLMPGEKILAAVKSDAESEYRALLRRL